MIGKHSMRYLSPRAIQLTLLFLSSLMSATVWSAPPVPHVDGKDVTALLEAKCHSCHAGAEPFGKLRLDQLDPQDSSKESRKLWRKVRDQVESGLMPPKEEDTLSKEDRNKIVSWLNADILAPKCDEKLHPGRVTIRRLNRIEYQNTIRDLFGVSIDATAIFPSDDVGYGFDNIGDVLSMPPVLLEKYLAVAEDVSRKAIATPDADSAEIRVFPKDIGHSIYQEEQALDIEAGGDYLIRVRASADQAGPDKAKFELRLNDKVIDQYTIKGPTRESFGVFEHKTRLKKGRQILKIGFLNDYYEPSHPDPALKGDRNLFVKSVELVGPIGVLPKKLPEAHTWIFKDVPKEGSFEERARKPIKKIASRAFRRPVTNDETKQLLKLASMSKTQDESFERGVQIAMRAVLVSPQFLFRYESDPEESDLSGVRDLDEYELATRLSYFLWSSTPDEELLKAAQQGQLRANLDAQVNRMLYDERSTSLVDNFAKQWLQLRLIQNAAPDLKLFPEWNQDLRRDMVRETEEFFGSFLRNDMSLLDLLDSNYTYLNERLARHYGIEGVTGDEFRRVILPSNRRGGLLGQASVLTVTSNPSRTSPVKRGRWVLDNLLGAPPPMAPPNVPKLPESQEAISKAPLKERMAQHRSNPACSACHQRMDAIGFALENYDAVGKWREKDGSFEIDAAGTLPSGESFRGAAELRRTLKELAPSFRRCLSEKLLTYSIGRGIEESDECYVNAIAKEMEANGDRFSALVKAIVKSDPFQKRERINAAP